MSYLYQRFWNVRGRGFPEEKWRLLCDETLRILEGSGLDLTSPDGMDDPIVDEFEISFQADPGADPFIFSRFAHEGSCDTEGLSYDSLVVSILAIAKKVAPDILEVPWFRDQMPLHRICASKWENLPKGWTEESRTKFWNSMTKRAPKHPVSACIRRMEGKMDNPGAFCASLADREIPGWRQKKQANDRLIWVPRSARDIAPIKPPGTDLEIYVGDIEVRGKRMPFATIFQGRAKKPVSNYHYPSEAQRDKAVQEYITNRKAYLKGKKEKQEERKNFAHPFTVGSILYTSWGYDQTNVDFYQVSRVKGKTVFLRPIQSKIVRTIGRDQYYVAPVPNKFIGMVETRHIPRSNSIRVSPNRWAYLWDGKPKLKTTYN